MRLLNYNMTNDWNISAYAAMKCESVVDSVPVTNLIVKWEKMKTVSHGSS